jgi:hypothetical protein
VCSAMVESTSTLPRQFADLESFSFWGEPTEQGRLQSRMNRSDQELKRFYDAMLPRLDEIVECLNQYPLDKIPADASVLFNMAKALMEISNTVEKGRSAHAWAFDVTRFIPMHE